MGVIRELSESEIERLLNQSVIGRIACCDHIGRPYLVPIGYGYDGDAIYAHTGPGRKLDFMRAEARVTFEVDEAEASDCWSSVLCEGTFEELATEPERLAGLTAIYGSAGIVPELGSMTTIFRINITAKSGRYELPQ